MKTLVSVSVLNADLSALGLEAAAVERAGADFIHLDVMDGVFTGALTFGSRVIASLRPKVTIPFDVHLMVKNPTEIISLIAEAARGFKDINSESVITIHDESSGDTAKNLEKIRLFGFKAGLALSPETSVETVYSYLDLNLLDMILIMTVVPGKGGQKLISETLQKIKAVSVLKNAPALIEVDGGINGETSKLARENGANVLVAGSWLFCKNRENMEDAILKLKD